ncbi:hypothetical protein [Acinetobacter sp. ANC 3832]|uniref:hypothetical protein n=1 Tax=Acinetobacter sp. ANC 3832 TaxID=1977874 RepID=UPI000A3574AE|nr:hypothetical protein [Acinetobacter sp. ANC 3832]OTG90220.1 hypothetical protein B9T35_15525 [Acinetobacter sp. ANC 3832]
MGNKIKFTLNDWEKEHQEKIFFLNLDLGAEIHWFFTQALEAMKHSLFLPACISFIHGIEASIRVTYSKQLKSSTYTLNNFNDVPTLSNSLLKKAQNIGIPINFFKLPNEADFEQNLISKKPNLKYVEIVRVRHNLAHGNIFEFINKELGENNMFFTPECCKELTENLYEISKNWCVELSKFKEKIK